MNQVGPKYLLSISYKLKGITFCIFISFSCFHSALDIIPQVSQLKLTEKIEDYLGNGTIFYKHIDVDITHPALRYSMPLIFIFDRKNT